MPLSDGIIQIDDSVSMRQAMTKMMENVLVYFSKQTFQIIKYFFLLKLQQ